VSPVALARRVEQAIERLALGEHRGKRVRALSKGTLQRLGLAQALLRDDRLLIFDEPTHGFDPLWTARFRELVAELRRPDRAILVASHNLDELQRIADRVAILDQGRLQRVVDVRVEATVGSGAGVYRLVVVEGAAQVPVVFPAAVRLGPGEFEVPAPDLVALNRGLGELVARGTLLASVVPAYSTLERHFREAVGEEP
jgi:energy-coupling factor transporter ATP-binding protein EcfA2